MQLLRASAATTREANPNISAMNPATKNAPFMGRRKSDLVFSLVPAPAEGLRIFDDLVGGHHALGMTPGNATAFLSVTVSVEDSTARLGDRAGSKRLWLKCGSVAKIAKPSLNSATPGD